MSMQRRLRPCSPNPLSPHNSIDPVDKDATILRLRNQIQTTFFSLDEHQNLVHRRQQLEHCLMELRGFKERTHAGQREARETSERTAQSLRGEMESLKKELHSKNLQLNDVLTEAEGLAEHYTGRNQQLEVLRQHGRDLAETSETIVSEGRRLEGQKSSLQSHLGQIMGELDRIRSAQETSQKQLITCNSSKYELILESERLQHAILQYEDQNNMQDAEITDMVRREQDLQHLAELKQNEISDFEIHISEAMSRNQKLSTQIGLRRSEAQQLRYKRSDMQSTEKQAKAYLSETEAQMKLQIEETDFLLRRNGQIVDVNVQLQEDFKQCQKHLQNLMKLNGDLHSAVGRFRNEDQGIVNYICKRSSSKAKISESRVTEITSVI